MDTTVLLDLLVSPGVLGNGLLGQDCFTGVLGLGVAGLGMGVLGLGVAGLVLGVLGPGVAGLVMGVLGLGVAGLVMGVLWLGMAGLVIDVPVSVPGFAGMFRVGVLGGCWFVGNG